MIKFIVPGKPIAKKRPRFARRGKHVVTYNDQETEEGKFIAIVLNQFRNEIIKNAIVLDCIFHMPRPKGHYGSGKNENKLKKSAPFYHVKKPDTDNLVKFVKDCLNGIVWKDDSQVFLFTAIKLYSDNPRTIIKIEERVT